MSGEKEKLTGRAKQAAGDLTDDEELRREGKRDELAGKAKDKANEAIDKAKDKANETKDRITGRN